MGDLHDALLLGKTDLLFKLIQNGSDVNYCNSSGATPLHFAAFFNNVNAVEALIEYGATLDAQDNLGTTPLHKAAAKNNVIVIDRLVAAGCNPAIPCKLHQTPLHSAVVHGSYKAVKRLVAQMKPADIDLQDLKGCTALAHACFYGHMKTVELLVRRGASLNVVDLAGRSPVHWACAGGNLKVLLHLLEEDAFCAGKDRKGRSVSHYAAMGGSVEMVKQLSANLLNEVDSEGFTPLHYAVQRGCLAVVKVLLELGCDVNVFSNDGTTPLHIAASVTESCEVMEFLVAKVSKDALVQPNKAGLSPLHLACENHRLSRVDCLIAAGVDVDLPCPSSKATPLHCAILSGHQLIMKHLINAGVNCNRKMSGGFSPLHLAAYSGCLHLVETLLQQKVDVNCRDDRDRTPLMLAVISQNACSVVIIRLLESKADVLAQDDCGLTALHYAAAEPRGTQDGYAAKSTLELLLEAGADVTAVDSRGRNPLHLIVQKTNDIQQVKLLCGKDNVCIRRADKNGFLPVHYAAMKGRASICIMLLDLLNCGLDLPTTGLSHYLNPLHLAAIYRHLDVITAVIKTMKKSLNSMNQSAQSVFPDALSKAIQSTDGKRRIPLHYAMREGDLPCVIQLLKESDVKMSLNWNDADGLTPLHMAAAKGHLACIDYLLSEYPDQISWNNFDSQKRTALMLALTSSCDFVPPKFLSRVNAKCLDANGRGYLHRAVFARRTQLLPQLLKVCDVNQRDTYGVTPLHLAALLGDVEVCSQLVSAGASMLCKERHRFTPADCAAAIGHLPVLELLLVNPGDSRLSDDSAVGTGDEFAAEKSEVENDEKQRSPIVADKIEISKASAEIVTSAAVLLAARGGFLPCVIHLFECRPDLFASRDYRGRTALHLAAWRGHYETVEYLVERQADIWKDARGSFLDARDNELRTPLHLAVRRPEAVNTVDFLLHKGADVSLVDCDGNSVLHLCCIHRNDEAGKVVIEHLISVDESPARPLMNMTNEKSETALHIATRNGLPELLYALIPYTTSSWWKEDYRGRIPLCSAIEDTDVHECMVLLLKFANENGILAEEESMNSMYTSMRDRSSLGARRSSVDSSELY